MPKQRSKNEQYLRSLEGGFRVLSEEKRRVELSFSSEQPYERWFGMEVLCHDVGCVDLSRLKEVGALLFHHGRDVNCGSIPVGRIIEIRLDEADKKCRAVVEFDEDEKSDLIYQKVKSGSIRGVSVGYQINSVEEVKAGATSANGRFTGPCCIALKWTPFEISIEPIPADGSVGIGRGANLDNESEERQMGEELGMNAATPVGEKSAAAPEKSAPPAQTVPERGEHLVVPDVGEAVRTALAAERSRVTEIGALCRSFGMNEQAYIGSGKTLEEVRAAVLEQLAKTGGAPVSSARVAVTEDEEDRFRGAARDGLLMRMGFSVQTPAEGAQSFRGLSLRALAANCLQRNGVEGAVSMDDEALLRGALGVQERGGMTPGSAFVSIVNDTMGAVVSRGYIETPTTFQKWTGKGSNPNFKATKRFRLSAAGEVVEVTQNGEFKKDDVKDEGVDTRLKTYGKIFGFTRQAFIDDDLGMLAKAVLAQVRSCKRTINKKVYALLGQNGKYIDGKQLFCTEHANLGTAAALGVASLGELYVKMGKQKDLADKAFLNITPKYLLVPMTLSMEAFRLLRSTADPGAPNAGVFNPVQNLVEIVPDAELDQFSEKGFYMAASPADVDTIEVTYLNGKEEPTLESRVAWDTLGIEYRMFHDFNVSLLDYRGLSMNAGK